MERDEQERYENRRSSLRQRLGERMKEMEIKRI
jgi:hypothetical protein